MSDTPSHTVLIMSIALATSAMYVPLTTFPPTYYIGPYRPLRYTHTTGQADWYTCAAAVFALCPPTTSPIC